MKKKITGEFYEKLMKLMIPIVLQNLLLASVAVADAIMLGSVEQNSMSAVSLATPDPVYSEHVSGGGHIRCIDPRRTVLGEG